MAMLANRSYDEVKEVAVSELGFDPAGDFYTKTGDLRRLAEKVGVELLSKGQKKFKGWVHLPNKTIVAINRPENSKTWHWVVFLRENCSAFVLDPKPSIKASRRTDFGRMNPVAFIPVS